MAIISYPDGRTVHTGILAVICPMMELISPHEATKIIIKSTSSTQRRELHLLPKEKQQIKQNPRQSFVTNVMRMDTCHLIVQQSMSGNQLLMQEIHNHLETYSFSSQGLSEDHGRVNNVAANKHNTSQYWILLDNQSTVDIFINPRLVKDIRVTDTIMHIHCHSGTSSTRIQETLPGYGTVLFDPKGKANILSLSNVKKKYRVTFDSSSDDTFYIHKSDGSTRKFVALQNGGRLYFLNTAIEQKSLHQK
jgi:hypothetical protein